MKRLAMRKWICLAVVIACAACAAASLAVRFSYWELSFVYALITGGFAGVLFAYSHKNLSAAQGIMETAVLRIYPAVIDAQSDFEKKKWDKLREESAVHVSCFGILLGTTVVRFNQDGIKLRSIEIGSSHIIFGYETPADQYSLKKEKQSIRLLYSRPGKDELAELVETFSTHTGVVPVIVG